MKTIAIACISCLVVSNSATSAVTTFTFTGIIDSITANDNNIIGPVKVGDSVEGYFTFDPDGHLSGDAYSAVIAISVSGNLIEIESGLNYIRARNNYYTYDGRLVDRFEHGFDSAGPTEMLDPLQVTALRVWFTDPTATVFDGSEVLPVDLNLVDFAEATWFFRGTDYATRTDRFQLGGTITSISVPETNALLIIPTTGILLVCRRTRKANKTSLLTPDLPFCQAVMTATTSTRSRSLAPGQA